MDSPAFLIALALSYFWLSLCSKGGKKEDKKAKYVPWLKIDRIEGK